MLQGWVSVYRQLQDHWLWSDKPFAKGQAWVDMLLSANHEDTVAFLGRSVIEVKTGSFITSEVYLSERWGWSRQKVRDFLALLVSNNMITKKTTNKNTTIFIHNYAVYQPCVTNKNTSKKHQKNTNNNDNNENNNISTLSIGEIECFCLENDLKVDARKFLAYYKKSGWVDKNGNPIQDWKSAAVCWDLNERAQKNTYKQKNHENKEPPSFNLDALEQRMRESDGVV